MQGMHDSMGGQMGKGGHMGGMMQGSGAESGAARR
jgi:hypothetical protein